MIHMRALNFYFQAVLKLNGLAARDNIQLWMSHYVTQNKTGKISFK
jgi:hypothetical protein